MKKIIDNIILIIFYILCIMSFLLIVVELPNFLNKIFDTTKFDNTQVISLVFCVTILLYVINYYSNKNSNEFYKNDILEQKKLQTIRNIYTYDYNNLEIIQKIEFSEFNKVHIFLLNNYNFNIELGNYIYIDNQKALENLDNFINSLKYEPEEISIPLKYERDVTEYLTKLKKELESV